MWGPKKHPVVPAQLEQTRDVIQKHGMTLEATATDVALAISLVVKAKEIALMIQTACLG